MNTTQVRDMFNSYTDESDRTFLTDAQITLYLSEGYSDFRKAVCEIDPYIFATEFLFELTNANEIDLTTTTPRLLSTAAAAATAGSKLERLLRIARIDSIATNNMLGYLDGVSNEKVMGVYDYTFVGSKIIFSGLVNGPFRLEYVPYHNIDFAATDAHIDNLDNFHGMIPLYAYQRYGIRDGAPNPQVQTELGRQLLDLKSFLESGRNRDSHYIVDYDSWF